MRTIHAIRTQFITEVTTREQERIFLEMPSSIYKGDPNYVRPLDRDIVDIFDAKLNPLLKSGACRRWLLWTKSGICIGRVAAFYKVKPMEGSSGQMRKTGGIGFFECIDDQEAAAMLFDQARAWLMDQQIKVIHGPVNFGSRHQWWGLLVEGFTMPNYGNNYHPAYYQSLFENYGFELNYRQLTYSLNQQGAQSRVFQQVRTHFNTDSRYAFKPMNPARPLDAAVQFQRLYNKTWALQEGLPALCLTQVLTLMEQLGDVLDPKLIWFGYYNQEPIAFFAAIPELNQLIVQHVGGSIGFIDRFKLASRRWQQRHEKAFGAYYGVLPDFRHRGVELGLIAAMQDAWSNRLKIPYKSIEFNWIGDYNPRMLKLMQLTGATVSKVHQTYRLWV